MVSSSPDGAALQRALALHNHGQLDEAARIYETIVAQNPRQADALHLLGLVWHQRGDQARALEWVSRAVAVSKKVPRYHNTLGEIYRTQGNASQAKASFRTALRLDPGYAEAHNNLGLACEAIGEMEEAERHLRRALALAPGFAPAHYNLGRVLATQGNVGGATESYRACIAIAPDAAPAYNNLGLLLQQQGDLAGAKAYFDRATQLAPDFPEAWFNLAEALRCADQHEMAVDAFREGLRRDPEHADAYLGLATSLRTLNKFEAALLSLGEYHKRQPGTADSFALEADVHAEMGQASLGIAAAERALSLRPDDVDVLTVCADLHCQGGNIQKGIAFLKEAVSRHPARHILGSSLLFHLAYDAEATPEILFAAHHEWARRHAASLLNESVPSGVDADLTRPLRIGYVSPDFKRHPVGFLLQPILAHHDHAQFHIVLYSEVAKPDAVTERFMVMSDEWRDIRGRSDADVATMVRADHIDILVDLTGHTSGNRLLAFARKPAPVQATWLGYFDTTGMSAMDYLIADEYSVPPTARQQFVEQVMYLPHSRFCYTGPLVAPEVAPLPAQVRGYVTFGCFNSLAKLNDRVIALWGRVLRALPDSRLVLKRKYFNDPVVRDRFVALFAGQQVTEDRLEFRPESGHEVMLQEYGDIDIALDPFPYTGGMTTLEALWMGVPVVTLLGETLLSRQSGSFLHAIGLDECVAGSEDRYVDIAVGMASDRDALADLRAGLRLRMQASPMSDPVSFTQHLEAAFREMWRAKVRAEPPV